MIESQYTPATIENKWYEYWERNGLFTTQVFPKSGKKFNIAIPPPNVTGTLHMGHGFECTVIDTLVRFHRMRGDITMWTVGTDHAGIATQMVVEKELQKKQISKQDLGREKFIEAIWEWKDKSGSMITNQLRKLGCSVDWDNEYFTMQPEFKDAVVETFVRLYEKGLIYRAAKMINWDTQLMTAVSDLEVDSVESNGKMWYIKYPLKFPITFDGKSTSSITVATTRPETMLGDAAVAIHPDDPRADALVGQSVILPITLREIPIIKDEMVDMDTGSGFVKITPAHDFNDFEVGKRHQLPCHSIMSANGSIVDGESAQMLGIPAHLHSIDRFVARKKLIAELKQADLLEKIEEKQIMLPIADRSNSICEPRITMQWFVKAADMANSSELAVNAIDAVEQKHIEFIPENWKNTYFAWMNNIHDWCISRQLWWGHRIPAWYDEAGNCYVGRSEESIRKNLEQNGVKNITLKQDDDVLDTWFSSAMWSFGTLGWPQNLEKLKQWHPTSLLVTGFDIIFFWVARMILMTTQMLGEIPFEKVMIHGLILDGQGQKMSKSKGNTLDPLDLIEGIDLPELIEKRTANLMLKDQALKITKQTRKEFPNGIQPHGVDALRMTYCSLSGASRDIHFDMQRLGGYRNFCNKVWHAARFCFIHAENKTEQELLFSSAQASLDRWIVSETAELAEKVASHLDNHRVDLASDAYYHFVWDVFCDWYLELVKAELLTSKNTQESVATMLFCLDQILMIGHPFIPFLTEEIYQSSPLRKHTKDEKSDSKFSIMVQPWPKTGREDAECEDTGRASENKQIKLNIEMVQKLITQVRKLRSEYSISPAAIISANLFSTNAAFELESLKEYEHLLMSVGKIRLESSSGFSVQVSVDHIILKLYLQEHVNWQLELDRVNKFYLKQKDEVSMLSGQLSNRNFIKNAPVAVVAEKREKLEKAEAQIKVIEVQITDIEQYLK